MTLNVVDLEKPVNQVKKMILQILGASIFVVLLMSAAFIRGDPPEQSTEDTTTDSFLREWKNAIKLLDQQRHKALPEPVDSNYPPGISFSSQCICNPVGRVRPYIRFTITPKILRNIRRGHCKQGSLEDPLLSTRCVCQDFLNSNKYFKLSLDKIELHALNRNFCQ